MERVKSPFVTPWRPRRLLAPGGQVVRQKVDVARQILQVPAAPGTFAWPPKRPSTPTSRATVRYLIREGRQRAVMLLIVSARAATSPFAFTVSFCVSSPLATAVTTLTMAAYLLGEVGGHHVHVVRSDLSRCRPHGHLSLAAPSASSRSCSLRPDPLRRPSGDDPRQASSPRGARSLFR